MNNKSRNYPQKNKATHAATRTSISGNLLLPVKRRFLVSNPLADRHALVPVPPLSTGPPAFSGGLSLSF